MRMLVDEKGLSLLHSNNGDSFEMGEMLASFHNEGMMSRRAVENLGNDRGRMMGIVPPEKRDNELRDRMRHT